VLGEFWIGSKLIYSAILAGSGSGRSHRASHVYEYYEELHERHYVIAPVLSHWRSGAVALWH
jgi:hypothetical protein